MPMPAMRVIDEWLAERRGGNSPQEPLFTNHVGGQPSQKQIGRVVRDTGAKLILKGVNGRLLRHTMASLLRERGVSLDTIRDRLGHESIATTERYVHAVPIGQAEAAEKLADL